MEEKSIKKINEELAEALNKAENIQKFLEEDYIKSNKQPLYEFADIVPEDTNLVCVIWVDGPRKMPHSKRVKFQNNTSTSLNGGELIPITISDNPQIPNKIKSKLNIKEKELTRIKQWIILNKQILLDYADGKITTKKLYELIQPLND